MIIEKHTTLTTELVIVQTEDVEFELWVTTDDDCEVELFTSKSDAVEEFNKLK